MKTKKCEHNITIAGCQTRLWVREPGKGYDKMENQQCFWFRTEENSTENLRLINLLKPTGYVMHQQV